MKWRTSNATQLMPREPTAHVLTTRPLDSYGSVILFFVFNSARDTGFVVSLALGYLSAVGPCLEHRALSGTNLEPRANRRPKTRPAGGYAIDGRMQSSSHAGYDV